jgi:hypothetical protein
MMPLEISLIKESCVRETRREWLAVPDTFPDFLTEIPGEVKTQNEKYIQAVSDAFQSQVKCLPIRAWGRKKWKQNMFHMLKQVLSEETVIGLHESMNQKSAEACVDELRDFLRHVRAFAPELSIDGIGQAIRNYIVYAMFNEMNNTGSGFRMAAFGYSMLYPFTDNFIDSMDHSDHEKMIYNQIIRDKIEGKTVHPGTTYQRKTCRLLEAIESEYDRKSDPTIFILLRMMLEAQEDSIRQQKKGNALTGEQRLDISLRKGGISVLIDRFFVRKNMSRSDVLFYYGFGFFLQLSDDLQDIKSDSSCGYQTLLTENLRCGNQEKIVNRMLHFVHRIICEYPADNEPFKLFVLSNCIRLTISSVFGSRAYFSKEYLDRLEKFFPVSFSFLGGINRVDLDGLDKKSKDRYMKMLDAMIA